MQNVRSSNISRVGTGGDRGGITNWPSFSPDPLVEIRKLKKDFAALLRKVMELEKKVERISR